MQKVNNWVDSTSLVYGHYMASAGIWGPLFEGHIYGRNVANQEPTSWALNTGKVSIYVTCAHVYYPGEWLLICREAGIERQQMRVKAGEATLEEVQRLAVSLVRAKLESMLKSLP